MNAQSIGECAAAIGWLAREGKIQFINLPDREEALYIELNLYIG